MESKNDFSNNETKDTLDSNPKFSKKYWFVIFIVILALSLLALGWILYYQNSKIAQLSTTSQEIKPDEIVITKLPNGNQLVENKTRNYSFEMPVGWVIPSSTNSNSGNGSISFVASENNPNYICHYSVSQIPIDDKNLSLKEWYYKKYFDTDFPFTIKETLINDYPAIEINTDEDFVNQFSEGVKNIYIADSKNNLIYAFGYDISSLADKAKCDPGLEMIIQSFNVFKK